MLTVGLNILGKSNRPGLSQCPSRHSISYSRSVSTSSVSRQRPCSPMRPVMQAASAGLFWEWPGGQAVSGWCLAMAILSTSPLLACVCICRCATCCSSAIGTEVYNKWGSKHPKHVFGNSLHEPAGQSAESRVQRSPGAYREASLTRMKSASLPPAAYHPALPMQREPSTR